MARKIVVIGVGNLLLGDEGIGVHIINELKNLQLPDNVEVYDCGTGGLSILSLLEGFDRAVVVDAVKRGGEPGTVYRFRIDKISDENRLKEMISFHELDLGTVIGIGSKTCKLPSEIVMIGVEPKSIEVGLNLSPEVTKKKNEVIKLVIAELDQESQEG